MPRRKNDKPYDILGGPEPRTRKTSKPKAKAKPKPKPKPHVSRTPSAAYIKAILPMLQSEAKRLRGIAESKAKRDRERARTLPLAGEESRAVKPRKPKAKKPSITKKRTPAGLRGVARTARTARGRVLAPRAAPSRRR